MIWLNETREEIKADNPGISFVDIAKKGGEIWKKMSPSDKSVNYFSFYYIIIVLFINN